VAALLLGRIFEERTHAGKLARSRRRPEALRPALSEEGAKVWRGQPDKPRSVHGLAAVTAKKIDQSVRGRRISANGMRGMSAIMFEIPGPLPRKGARRMVG
jgi:hypothetical protein